MIRSMVLTALLLVLLAPPAVGQAQEGHVDSVNLWDAKTGHAPSAANASCDQVAREITTRMFSFSAGSGAAHLREVSMKSHPRFMHYY